MFYTAINFIENMELEKAKELIKSSNKITILTGAGISTESGVPDFRSPGGVWDTFKTVTFQEFISDTDKRKYYWQYKAQTIPVMLNSKPNPAHTAIAALDKQNKLLCLLTQNIDGLHEKGGISPDRIINLHGTNRQAVCLSCNKIININEVLAILEDVGYDPRCMECGGFLKPDTVSFGQSLNPNHLEIAHKSSSECDLFMALGSSLMVYPAAGFVDVARHNKIPVIIINKEKTPFDKIAAVRISGSLGEVLPQIIF